MTMTTTSTTTVATAEDVIRHADADHTPRDGAVDPWLRGGASYVVYGDADFVDRFTRPMIGALTRCIPRDAQPGALVFDRPMTLNELDVDDPQDLTFSAAVASFGLVIYQS